MWKLSFPFAKWTEIAVREWRPGRRLGSEIFRLEIGERKGVSRLYLLAIGLCLDWR
jgi:hypothetical protein